MNNSSLHITSVHEGLTNSIKGECGENSVKLKPNNSPELTLLVFIIFAIIISATFGVSMASGGSVVGGPGILKWLFFTCLCGMVSGILSGYFFSK